MSRFIVYIIESIACIMKPMMSVITTCSFIIYRYYIKFVVYIIESIAFMMNPMITVITTCSFIIYRNFLFTNLSWINDHVLQKYRNAVN